MDREKLAELFSRYKVLSERRSKGENSDELNKELGDVLENMVDLGLYAGGESRRAVIKPDGFTETRGKIFKSFGEQLVAVYRSGLPGAKPDPRLYEVRAPAGLGETVPSDGGFLVESVLSREILGDVWETGKLAKLCRNIPISNASGLKIPAFAETSRATGSRLGGVTGYWKSEGAEKTSSKPTFRQMELTLKKLIGLCYASDELLEDAVALGNVIKQAFISELSFMTDDAIVNGTGVGQPLGILQSPSLVAVTRNGAGTIATSDIFNIWSRCLNPTKAVWLVNSDILPTLFAMTLTVGTAGGVTTMIKEGELPGSPPLSMLGIPLIPIEQCQTLGTKGDIYLANLAEGYVLISKDLKVDVSIHVRFIYDESCFRFVLRIDGQPILSNAITPFKGSATKSHFVCLTT